jgi:ABC-type nitrate/sulfonate/bicarbonate transport system substrate-binding protein
MAELIGGSLDITHGDTSSFLSAADKSAQPIKVVNIFRDKEWWIMGVRAGINSAEDLKGKKITGGPLDGRNTWVQRQLVAGLGLNPDADVEWVPTSGGSDNRLQALIAGTVDAASLFPRHRPGLEGVGGKFLVEQLTEAPQEGFGAMGTWLEANPDTAAAWHVAEIKGRQWIFDPANKDEAYKIMRDLGFEIPPEFEAQYQLELDQLSPDGGFESAEVMDKFIASLAETGEVPTGMDWRPHVDMTYVWAAQETLGLPKRPASL